ncbi:zeta toxin family protein [Castellaniella sp. S9]|uniref:zeta toxin family protein n=1 Tax=Castellaniella sp. S9 TaxID=2993652 RepID=UPI0022B50068|nr:zeta toxin family protein [Castellaniella sp. S9]
MQGRPVLYVLAGVNGAGKSSIGGYLLTQAGLAWYNPDDFARALVTNYGVSQEKANIEAWQEGVRRLRQAMAARRSFAFETTLGGHSITQYLLQACKTHDVMVWYCGLRDPQLHLDRIKLRVRNGGHDIPEAKVRQRWVSSLRNLIVLMPSLAYLRVYDNSTQFAKGQAIGEPKLLLEMRAAQRIHPAMLIEAVDAPEWVKPALEAAFELDPP